MGFGQLYLGFIHCLWCGTQKQIFRLNVKQFFSNKKPEKHGLLFANLLSVFFVFINNEITGIYILDITERLITAQKNQFCI